MSHLLFWPTVTFFYPIGNTSAVCLTENLSPERKADILLLACGDPRNILFTVYADETNPLACQRTLDITCCDVDVAILARNALLFTILADDGALDKLDSLWNLFYHMFVDQASLLILRQQCHKLIALAENAETWRAGPYGHFLTTCDVATLLELRRVWKAYLDAASLSPKQRRRLEQRIIDGMKEISRKIGAGGTTSAARSAGPLSLHANLPVANQFSSYWSSGSTDGPTRGQGQGRKQHLTANPTFNFSIDGDKFSVHYGTDPLSGFHLAEAFASGKFSHAGQEPIPTYEMVRIAKEQFSCWCTSMTRRLKDNTPSSPTFVIRLFAGDLLMFCHALKYCEVLRSNVTPYNVAAWRLSTITLDEHYYGRSVVSPAPLSFNVIDTSNSMDHVGLLNVLIVTVPLLCKTPSATLYTEALRIGNDPSKAIFEHVCGDLATMALVLGVIPSTFMSQFTSRSNVHETLVKNEGAKQYHERMSWKAIGFGGSREQCGADILTPPQRLCFAPKDLAAFLFRIYVQMFFEEDIESKFQLLSLSPEDMMQMVQRIELLHYNRRSFALLVHFVKTRVQTNWWSTMDVFDDMVLADERLMMGHHAYQELCCQLHLLDVHTPQWMSPTAVNELRLEYRWDHITLFHDWAQSSIPQIITLVLVVPRDVIARLEPDFMDVGTPTLHCDMHDGPRQSWFAVTSATFGTLHVSGKGEHRVAVVIEGDTETGGSFTGVGAHSTMQPLWRSGAPLIITCSVPSTLVMHSAQNPRTTVGLALRPTMAVTAKFADRLGYTLRVFKTLLTDAKRVFLLARCPTVGTKASTSPGGNAMTSAAIAGHWKENVREDSCTQQTISSLNIHQRTCGVDVRVQMNNVSSAVRSFTVRVNVTDPGAKVVLADRQTVPIVDPVIGSSLDACVRVGTHKFPVQFPLPVDLQRTKLRVARKSSYIEVTVPLASFDVRPEQDLSHRFASLSSRFDDDATPTLGSIHRLNLDRCPAFKLSKGQTRFNWYDLHISLMFSENERGHVLCDPPKPMTTAPTQDTLLQLKKTLHLLLRATPDGQVPEKVFALCDTSRRPGEPYLFIFVACMRLDVGSHTVVADAFVGLPTSAVRAALRTALRDAHTSMGGGQGKLDVRFLKTDADETAAWFHLLPRLIERCRTWPHKPSCAYRASKHEEQKAGEETLKPWVDQNPLCMCGAGVGTEILPKAFEQVAPYLTRAAFSPLFSVPYLKEVDRIGGKEKPLKPSGKRARRTLLDRDTTGGTDGVSAGHRCLSCGGEGGLTCSRCKRARYCSEACQRADWKGHQKNCSACEAASGSNLA